MSNNAHSIGNNNQDLIGIAKTTINKELFYLRIGIFGVVFRDPGFDSQRSIGNVPFTIFEDEHDTVGFPIHSFSTFERIKKYDENENAGNVEKPYSTEVRGTERKINIYGIASTRFDIKIMSNIFLFIMYK